MMVIPCLGSLRSAHQPQDEVLLSHKVGFKEWRELRIPLTSLRHVIARVPEKQI